MNAKNWKSFLFSIGTVGINMAYGQLVGVDNSDAVGTKNETWKNRYYMVVGFNRALGAWHQNPETDNSVADAYAQNTGFGAKGGLSFEIGSVFYLRKIVPVLEDRLKFALKISYVDFSYVNFERAWKTIGYPFSEGYYSAWYFIGPKLGLQSSYRLSDEIHADIFYNIHPTVQFGGDIELENTRDYPVYESLNGSGFGTGMRSSFGANFRYHVFDVGLELVLGGVNLNSIIEYTRYDQVNSTRLDFTTRFRSPMFRLNLGFAF